MSDKYQDYVIKDGEFIGRFEEMYQKFDDPWEQSVREPLDASKSLILSSCRKNLEHLSGTQRVLEIGCGFGHLSAELSALGFDAIGVDISETAISKARQKYSEPTFIVKEFADTDFYREISPDIFIMAEITWYVLPELADFIDHLKKHHKGKLLIHSLVVYEEGVQKYGTDYFKDLKSILRYFDMTFLEYADIWNQETGGRTFFAARI